MRINRISIPTMALLAIVLTLNVTGCGGGAEDPTSVALKPSKEVPQGGNGGGDTKTNNVVPPDGPTEGFGGITGRIVIAEADRGSVPPPTVTLYPVGKAPVDSGVCASEMPILNQSLVVNPMTGGIKNTFFYLPSKPSGGKPTIESQKTWPTADESGAKLVLDQKNCTYVPHAMIVLVGQNFTVLSQDPVGHTYKGKPSRSPEFNPGTPRGVPIEINPFKRPENNPVAISCATHGWMSAYQLPLDHPYAAVTDDDGRFTISDLPSGSQTFTIWHEKGGKIRDYDVEVKANETVDLGDITLRLNQLSK